MDVSLDPQQGAERDGHSGEEGSDDPVWYPRAAIAPCDGPRAWLVRHRDERDAGTTVCVDAAADPGTTRALVLAALALGADDRARAALRGGR